MSLYKDRQAQGLCGACGKVATGGDLCAGCKEKSRERAAAKRLRNRGKCTNCGAEVVKGSRCARCKAVEKASRKRATLRRKAAGTCVQSGCHNAVKPGCTLCQACIDKRSVVSSKHYQRRKAAGLCRFCNDSPAIPGGAMCAYHQEKSADYRLQVKLETFEQYGGAFCSHCNELRVELLELHHVNGGGCKHRREIGAEGGGYNFYLWLRQEGYPAGYRVLCPTCHKEADYALRNEQP